MSEHTQETAAVAGIHTHFDVRALTIPEPIPGLEPAAKANQQGEPRDVVRGVGAHSGRAESHATIEDVEALFSQVNALALRLSQVGRAMPNAGGLVSPARAVVGLLALHGPRTVPRLASLRSTSRQNIQIIVNRLAQGGWVALSPNPAHKRSALVSLTEKGRVLLTEGEAGQTRWLEQVATKLPAINVSAATELLKRIRERLAQHETASGGTGTRQTRHASAKRGGKVSTENRRPVEGSAPEADVAEEFPVSLL